MKNLIKVLWGIISVAIIGMIIYIGWRYHRIAKQLIPNPSEKSGELTGELENSKDKNMDTIYDYIPLEEIPEIYSGEQAITDMCFVIKDNKTYNQNVLEALLFGVENKQDTRIRIAKYYSDKDVEIIDITRSGEILYVVEDRTRIEGGEKQVVRNQYNMSKNYVLAYRDHAIATDVMMTEYFLKHNTDESQNVLLFNIINGNLKEADYKLNEFHATITSGDANILIVEPTNDSEESKVSSEIKLYVEEDGTFKGISYQNGDLVKVQYDGVITEIDNQYEIRQLVSLEKIID